MSTFLQSYNKNVYFWESATTEGIMPTDSSCNEILSSFRDADEKDCSDKQRFATFNTEKAEKCVKAALCKNKVLSRDNIKSQSENMETAQRYLDSKDIYNVSFINNINLGVAIVAMCYFIYINLSKK